MNFLRRAWKPLYQWWCSSALARSTTGREYFCLFEVFFASEVHEYQSDIATHDIIFHRPKALTKFL